MDRKRERERERESPVEGKRGSSKEKGHRKGSGQ